MSAPSPSPSPVPKAPPPGLDALAASLEGAPPAAVLRAAAERFQPISLACSFGPEDVLLIDVIARERLPVAVFTLDTTFLFAETYALWTRIEERYRIAVHPYRAEGPDVPRLEAGRPPPWERDPDACCHARKVLPLRAALSGLAAWVTGIRREQTPERARAKPIEWDARFGLVKVNPLTAWKDADVWAYLRANDVPTNPLHAQGYLSIGCAPCTTPVRPGEDPRSGRWRGQEKKECGLHQERKG